ncbi:NRPS [Malassezia psittaci]|uniref:NRPS n=1 Tax=Malassezia psittaci TaxID=1821823 RepID=A0AAF0F9S8_9BASI|nr:NRPS [Malassezia psittaci]
MDRVPFPDVSGHRVHSVARQGFRCATLPACVRRAHLDAVEQQSQAKQGSLLAAAFGYVLRAYLLHEVDQVAFDFISLDSCMLVAKHAANAAAYIQEFTRQMHLRTPIHHEAYAVHYAPDTSLEHLLESESDNTTLKMYVHKHHDSKLDCALSLAASNSVHIEGSAQMMLKQIHAVLCGLLHNTDPHDALASVSLSSLTHPSPQTLEIDMGPGGVENERLEDQFVRRAHTFPMLPALACRKTLESTEEMSYAQLNTRADAIAEHLWSLNVGYASLNDDQDEIVALCMPKTTDMYACILGVLKSGAAWCPIDEAWPEERQAALLQKSKANVVLVDGKGANAVKRCAPSYMKVVHLDEISQEPSAKDSNSVRRSAFRASPDRLAYKIWTSGTTGLPKAVGIPHSAAVQGMRALCQAVPTTFAEPKPGAVRYLQFAAYVFDLSIFDIFYTWAHTGTVCFAPLQLLLDQLVPVATALEVTHTLFTPAVSAMISRASIPSMRVLINGGEKLSQAVADEWSQDCVLVNIYGPAEATLSITMHTVPKDDQFKAHNIGWTFPTGLTVVVDRYGRVAPRGAIGELLLGGPQLARGYIGDADKTREKFVEHAELGRVYHTGDLARCLWDGQLEYLGRNDDQVKINGVRIELLEINAAVKTADTRVRDADTVALPGPDDQPRIVSFVVAYADGSNPPDSDADSPAFAIRQDEGARALSNALRSRVEQLLPSYMVPSHFLILPAFPRTSSAKIDRVAIRKAYDSMDLVEWEAKLNYDQDAPADQESESLDELLSNRFAKAVCTELVQLCKVQPEQITPHVPFAALGVNSVRAMVLANRLAEFQLGAADFLRHNTLTKLAKAYSHADVDADNRQNKLNDMLTAFSARYASSESGSSTEVFPASGLQQSMLVETAIDPHRYWLHRVIPLQKPVAKDSLLSAIHSVSQAMQCLRLGFLSCARKNLNTNHAQSLPGSSQATSVYAPVYYAVAHRSPIINFREVHTEKAACDALDDIRQDVNPVDGLPPVYWTLLRAGDKTALVLSAHHAVYDAETLHRVLEMLDANLGSEAAISLSTMPPYSSALNDLVPLDDDEALKSLSAWRSTLQDFPCAQKLAFPKLLDATPNDSQAIRCKQMVSQQSFDQIEAVASRLETSVRPVLQVAWARVLCAFLQTTDVLLGDAVSLRTAQPSYATIGGPLLATLPVPIRLGKSAKEVIQAVHQFHYDMIDYAHVPLSYVRELLQVPNHRPLFESLFVLEADWDSTAEGKVLDLRHTLDLGVNVEHKLALEVRIESKGKMNLLLNYDTQLISESYAETLLKFTDAVLAEYVNHPTDCPSLCIPKDEHILSVSKKAPMAAHAMPVTQAFQESVSATPNAIAVEMLGLHDKDPIQTLTYAELDRRSRAVAQAIAQKSDRYAVIGVKMKRSLDTYVALLGTLRSGRIYLPLDESLPDLRREQLLEDSRCAFVIERESFDGADGAKTNTEDHHRVNPSAENGGGVEFHANTGAETISNSATVSSINIEDLIQLGASVSYTLPSIEANDAAYLLYTSGSTGTPKGCLLSQKNLACAIANFHQRFITADPLTFQDPTRFLARSAEAFDVHLLEALLPLSIGATIVTMPRARLLNDLGKAIAQASVSHACVVPSLFATKTGVVQPSDLPNLRLLVVGGEKISERIIQSWGDASVPVLNAYGPTETTIGISCADVQSSTLSSDIGSAFSGNQFVILANDAHSSESNSERRIAFRGEIGELCIVGNHVGLGYLNQVNPASFFTFQGKAAYATGDQARLMPNDHAEYLGREKQSQVKVRGARVELEEVNLAVLSQSDCAYAQTLLLSNSIQKEPHLVTFLSREARTTNSDLTYDSEVCNVENVVKKLRSTLSSYMVPSKLIPLNYLPLANVSGKVDLQALRHYYETACASSSIDAAAHYQGATTKEQQLITSLVMKLLQLEDPPSIDADLFGHGLDSIRAVRLAYALEEEKYSVPLVRILAEPTIAEIATNLTHTHDEASDSARDSSEPRGGVIGGQNSGQVSAQDVMQGKVYTGPQNDMQDADHVATGNVAQEATGSASQDSMQDASKAAPQDASQNALQGASQGAPQEATQNALSTPTNPDSTKAHNSVYHSDSVNHQREPTLANAHTSSKEDFSKLSILPAELQSCENLIAAAPCVPLQVATIARTLEVPSERLYINHIRIAKEPSVAKRWATCMTHHGIYRTRFIATRNTFVQAVTNLPVQVSVRSTQCTDAQCDAVADQIIARFMDQPPVQLVEYEDMICISMHHAVYDAASFALLQQEVSQSKPDRKIDLEKAANTFDVDYLAFAHRVATSEAHTTEYWTKKLSDMVYTPCPIMTGEDLPKAAAKSVQFTLRESLNEIQSQAQHARISLHAYILTKFCSLFAQYVGEEEVTIGLVLSGRLGEANHAQLHGPCTTTVPFRFQDGAEAFKATQKQLYEMLPYQFVRLASVARAINCTQLFDVLFSYLPDSTIQAEAQDTAVQDTAVQDAMLTGYPLALEVRTDSTQDALQLELVYCPDRIPTQQADKMLRQLAALVQGDESSPKVGDVDRSVVNAEPRQPTPKDGFLALFAKHSATSPEKEAITFATSFDPAQFKRLSFRELNEESCKYAHRLMHKQGDGDVVYVHLTRRMELYIMMLAVWKAGKTYVPLDPTLPADRLVYMMETVGSGSLVTDSGLATNNAQGSDRLPFDVPNGVKVIRLQELSQDGISTQNGNTMPNEMALQDGNTMPKGVSLQNDNTQSDGASLPNGNSLSDPHQHCNLCCSSSTSFQLPAYILFTSGSTGRPKGVQISHRALAAAIVSWREMLPFSKDSRMLQLASPGFDVSVFEVTFPLAMGFAIGSAPKDLLLSDLESAFSKLQITLADLPAALAGLLHPDRIPPLEWLMSGGDVIDQRVIQQWTTPPARLINAYGPTEGTIGNTLGFMNQSTRRNVVGYAYPTSTIYIMPREFHSHSLPVYAGAIGELVVGGAQVADAYVNADQLTKEKFPLYNGQRVYRTGDRARLLYDQRLECLGRIERGQVKVNGQRVELEEIAHALSMEQEVKDACVLYLKHPTHLSKQLVAFLARDMRSAPAVGQDLRVYQDSAEVAASILQSAARKLAAYMVPTQVIMLEHALPLTPNNKVDVKRLSEQYESLDRSMLQALQPRSSTNQAKPKSLDRVCQALKQIGVHLHTDDGGDGKDNGDGNTSLEDKGNSNANGDANHDSKRNASTASNAFPNINADASTSANTNATTSTNAITNSLANASFYALGIDSLSAIQVVRLLRSEQFPITAAELLQLGTPWRLAEHWDAVQGQKSSSNGSESNNVPTEEHSANGNTQLDRDMDANQLATACLPQRDVFKQICETNPDAIVYPATPLQVGMLTQSVQTDGSLYIHTHTFRIHAPTEIVAKVWRLLVKANTILRTSFRLVDDAKVPWVQVVHRDIQPEILETNQTPSRWTPDLITEKVLHTMQLQTEENSTVATLRIHHALYDAHALDELMDDFDTLVRQATLRSINTLTPVSRPAYARLVPYLLSGENHVDYWVQTLNEYRPRRLVPGTGSLQGCTASRILNLDISTLQQQCRSANVSMHTLASLAFARLLALCTQTPDVCFGQVVSLRADVQDADRVIGPALNTIPVRINTLNASLQSVQKATDQGRSHRHASLRAIQNALRTPTPLIDALLDVQRVDSSLHREYLELVPSDAHHSVQYALNVAMIQHTDHLELVATSKKQFADEAQLQDWLAKLEELFDQCAKQRESSFDTHLFKLNPTDADRLELGNDQNLTSHRQVDHSQKVPNELLQTLCGLIADLAEVEQDEIHPETSLLSLGLDSIATIRLAARARLQGLNLSAEDLACPDAFSIAQSYMRSHASNDDDQYKSQAENRDRDKSQSNTKQSKHHNAQTLATTQYSRSPISLQQAASLLECPVSQLDKVLSVTSGQKMHLAQWVQSGYRNGVYSFVYTVPELNFPALQRAWHRLQERHAILRTIFAGVGQPVQPAQIQSKQTHPLQHWEVRSMCFDELSRWVIQQQKRSVLSISQAMVQCGYVQGSECNGLVLTLFHAMYDAWSLPLLVSDLESLYNEEYSGGNRVVPQATPQVMSQETNQETSQAMPQITSKETSQTTSQLASQERSQTTPQVTPQVTQKASPKATPESTSKSTISDLLIEYPIESLRQQFSKYAKALPCWLPDSSRNETFVQMKLDGKSLREPPSSPSFSGLVLACIAHTLAKSTQTQPVFGVYHHARLATIPGIEHLAVPCLNMLPLVPEVSSSIRQTATDIIHDMHTRRPYEQASLEAIHNACEISLTPRFNLMVNLLPSSGHSASCDSWRIKPHFALDSLTDRQAGNLHSRLEEWTGMHCYATHPVSLDVAIEQDSLQFAMRSMLCESDAMSFLKNLVNALCDHA